MGQINGVFSYFRDNLWRFLGSGWYWRWYSVVLFGLFGSFLRIGRNTSGRRWSSGDGYSLELFGRDSISFVIKMVKLLMAVVLESLLQRLMER